MIKRRLCQSKATNHQRKSQKEIDLKCLRIALNLHCTFLTYFVQITYRLHRRIITLIFIYKCTIYLHINLCKIKHNR